MLWLRATGLLTHPPGVTSPPELGVCLTIKATTFYSVCTEPKQTTVYRLLFSFLFEMRRFSVLSPVIRPVYPPFPPTMAQQTGRRSRCCHHSTCTAPLRPVKGWGQGQELVSIMATWEQCGPSGPAVHAALFNTVN